MRRNERQKKVYRGQEQVVDAKSAKPIEKTTEVLIEPNKIRMVRDFITKENPSLIWEAFSQDERKIQDLKNYLEKATETTVKSILKNEKYIDYFISETIGLGFLDELVKMPEITDLGYNGTQLVIQTNSSKYVFKQDSKDVTEEKVSQIIQKMASALNKTFSSKDPILDGVFKTFRINAVHRSISPYGTSMSLRVSHKRMVLNQTNFHIFAPMYILELFEVLVKSNINILISGMTSTGKTELQKLLISFIPFKDKIIMIEDVLESHVKELFPKKDITSWITGPEATIAKLVKASLRNNPDWVCVSETRGAEANEMFQAVLSGSAIITTLHAPSAHKIVDRFINMITDSYPNTNEARLEKQILGNFNLGIHIEYVDVPEYDEKTGQIKRYRKIRYLAELVEFTEEGINTLFKQKIIAGRVHRTPSGDISEFLKEKIQKSGNVSYKWKGADLGSEEYDFFTGK